MQRTKYFFRWWKHQCNCTLESCTEESSIAPEFLGHCRNDAPTPATFFFKTRRGQIRQVMRVGNYSHVFSSRELLLLLLVGPSSEYGTCEYSSTWVLWMLCAQNLKHKKPIFFLHCIFKINCFWIYSFLCNMLFGRKWTGRMDGWMAAWLLLHIL
jgi:hypothetical protein